ncbi:hypothetical protein GGTG_14304 [Gaeumannomyces tritici R3-111a-1]|uniref:Uncharacterized protein n=1 Tax=Gaeumannomyces tritici (strain R3-111a-1) TaxID=644352 RepID=J3PL57_GAET3|nr:hypothetical protein GGTG_14304 [Gaeumannomyces tritici R3-111a-1]EJT68118.1 hypothetical protein GGTG_14304 [Gaeumannomyces tritici R3-111a-1]
MRAQGCDCNLMVATSAPPTENCDILGLGDGAGDEWRRAQDAWHVAHQQSSSDADELIRRAAPRGAAASSIWEMPPLRHREHPLCYDDKATHDRVGWSQSATTTRHASSVFVSSSCGLGTGAKGLDPTLMSGWRHLLLGA